MKENIKGILPSAFPKAPTIVLVKPQMGENIGKAARAMLNCGFTDLRLVSPRDGWPNERANACCSGAYHVIDNAQLFKTVQDAVADKSIIYASTARLRDMTTPVLELEDATRQMTQNYQGSDVAILFGCERSGLDNDDVALCDYVLNIPLNPEFSSLNLSQAVLLICYSWFSKIDFDFAQNISKTPDRAPLDLASKKELHNFFDHLEEKLSNSGFFKTDELKPKVMRNLQGLFSKADLTPQEVQTLHGILVSLSGEKRK